MVTTKITVGNVEIIALVDMPMEVSWQIIFAGIPLSDFEAYRELYPKSFGEGGFATQCGAYALRSEGHMVLCDTGIGPGPIQFLGGARGRLLDDMRDKGVPPEDIDTVVFTHLHGDHVGWTLSPEQTPNFPKARFLVPQADWDYSERCSRRTGRCSRSCRSRRSASSISSQASALLRPEITTYPTPGHTRPP